MNEARDNATVTPAAALTEDVSRESQRVLRLFLFDALASEAMGTLTTGVSWLALRLRCVLTTSP